MYHALRVCRRPHCPCTVPLPSYSSNSAFISTKGDSLLAFEAPGKSLGLTCINHPLFLQTRCSMQSSTVDFAGKYLKEY